MGHFVLNILSVISSVTTIFVAILGFKSNSTQPIFFIVITCILALQTAYLIFARNYIKLSKVKGNILHTKRSTEEVIHSIQFGIEFIHPPTMEIMKNSSYGLYEITQVNISTTNAEYAIRKKVPGLHNIMIKWIASGKEKV